MKINGILRIALGFLLVGAFMAQGQETRTLSSERDQSRPLSEILSQFRKNERVPVCYEDPRYRNATELQDVTDSIHRGTSEEAEANKSATRVIVPKGYPLTFVYARDAEDRTFGRSSVERMVRQYEDLGGPHFIVQQEGPRLFVEPHLVKDEQGHEVEEGSVLDIRITVAPKTRTGVELLEAVFESVKAASGFEIKVGSNAPTNLLHGYRTDEGFENLPARLVLANFLDSLSKRQTYVWDLYYGPAERYYVLNFNYVEKR